MVSEIPARDKHEEGGEVVGNEEVVSGDKDEVVEEIDSEIGNAEIKNKVLERVIGGSESSNGLL